MFAYLEGNLTYKSPALLHLAIGGVAYEVHISLRTYDKIQALDAVRLYTHVQVREDGWTIFGFADEQERATFRALLAVNGVGATTARLILSSLSPAEISRAIAQDDHRLLGKVKGIGPKTAQRMVLELKGKLMMSDGDETMTGKQGSWHNTTADDALIALMNLGIARTAAEAALKKVPDAENKAVEELLREALRNL